MIIKTKHNASASATIEYNLKAEKTRGILYHSENLRVPLDPFDERGKAAMTADFNYQVSEQHKNPIGHSIINFGADPTWEQLDRKSKEQFCRDFIESKGLESTQYFVVEHHDTDFKHLHIVYNKTDNFGKGIHQDKHAIDDNILTYKLGKQYGLEIPVRTKDFIDNQLRQDPDYLEKVANRHLANSQKTSIISDERLAHYREVGILKQARNEHHLGKLAAKGGVSFSVSETAVKLGNVALDRGELAAVLSSNRSDYAEQKLAIKQANKAQEVKASKPDYLQKIERKQLKELARQRKIAIDKEKERASKIRIKEASRSNGRGRGRGLSRWR